MWRRVEREKPQVQSSRFGKSKAKKRNAGFTQLVLLNSALTDHSTGAPSPVFFQLS